MPRPWPSAGGFSAPSPALASEQEYADAQRRFIERGVDGFMADIAGKSFKKRYDLTKPQGVRGRNSDNTLITKYLGWAPSIRLRDGMAKTYSAE